MRILITGVPGSGKTTIAKSFQRAIGGACAVVHWDNYKALAWDAQPNQVLKDATVAEQSGHVIVEGCGAVRLLKRGWSPEVVIECRRAALLDPKKHAGIAGVIARQLGAWPGTVYSIDDAMSASSLLSELGAEGVESLIA